MPTNWDRIAEVATQALKGWWALDGIPFLVITFVGTIIITACLTRSRGKDLATAGLVLTMMALVIRWFNSPADF